MNKGHKIKVLDKGYVIYADRMGTDADIAAGARTSYGSALSKGEEADKKLINYLYKNKHTSPFELVKIKFQVKMPIFVMRQWVRHRMQNLNEVSARYSVLSNEFYIPEVWRTQDTKNRQGSVKSVDLSMIEDPNYEFKRSPVNMLIDHCKTSYDLYEAYLKAGIAREMARIVLSLNIYTEIICTWDLKNLLHFIALRDDGHAQSEIQEYAKAIKSILKELFPWTMEVYEENKK